MTNEEIVELIQKGVDDTQSNLGILYKQNQPFIRKLCLPFSEYVELGDLMQEAYFGLVEAVNGFDASKGFKFITYLRWKVRNKCMSYVRNFSSVKKIPEYMQNRINEYKKLIKENNCVPDKLTTMKKMNLTEDQYDLMIMAISQKEVVSIDKVVYEEGELTVGDTIPDDTNIEEEFLMKDCSEQLWKVVMDILDDRKGRIIVGHFKKNQTLRSIAETEGISVQRIQSIKDSALQTLSDYDSIKEYAEFFGYTSQFAYSGYNPTEYIAVKHLSAEEQYQELLKQYGLEFLGA